MNKNLLLIAFLLPAFFVFNASAQTDAKAVWSRIENDDKTFSVAVPPGVQIFTDKKGYALTTAEGLRRGLRTGKFNDVEFSNIRYLTASTGDASFYIIRHKTNNLKDGFRILSDVKVDKLQITTATVNGFAVKIATDTTGTHFRQQVFIGYKDEIYEIFGGARSNTNENLRYLFASLKIGGEKPFAAATALDGKITEQTVALAALADTPFTVEEAKEKPQSKTTPTAKEDAQSGSAQTSAPGVTPLTVIAKISPQTTRQSRLKNTNGKVVLNVTFAANGSIEKIVVVSGLPNGLTEESVKAVRMMRFFPEEKDGVPVTVTRAVEYNFITY